MKVLLDTHVLIWLAEGRSELPRSSRKLIDKAASDVGLAVSAISFWEVAMLFDRGRISLSLPLKDWRRKVVTASGIIETPVTGEVGIEAVQLPGRLHGDPADRLLVATTRLNGWRLATRDKRLLDYGAAGHLATLKV